MPSLSIIVPVLNEADSLEPFLDELKNHVPEDFELIWVNDGSTDASLDIIKRLASVDHRIHCISFSRNFGHQAALLAGLRFATAGRIVMMDGDLQHPPSLIPALLQKLNDGYDLVSARKNSTEQIGFTKRILTASYYRLLNFLSDTRIEAHVADFRALNRKVADALLQFEERELFLRGLFSWMGFRSATVSFDAPARLHGTSKYSFTQMARLGLRGTLAFSFKPIRLALLMGSIFSFVAFAIGLFALFAYLKGRTIPGWSSTIIAIVFLGGIQLIMIGLIGEYIASMYQEAKKRPHYLIDEKINFD